MTPKTGLREFQEQLAARLAANGEAGAGSQLGFAAAGRFWLLPLADSGELLSLAAPLLAVPLTQPWFAGVVNVRGSLYGVTDFSAFLGGEATPRQSDARLLLLAGRYAPHTALLVSRSFGLCPVSSWTAQPVEGEPAWVDAVWIDEQARRWQRIEVRALLASSEFLAVGR